MNSSDCAPERVVMLRRMREASNVFYGLAVQAGCHPFIEFTGLMNEYIKCCEAAHKRGVDFARCNKHAGQHLPMQDFRVDYINEKLECIFTGRSVMNDQQQQPSSSQPLAALVTAAEMARAALSELLVTRDPKVYSDALRALDDALGAGPFSRTQEDGRVSGVACSLDAELEAELRRAINPAYVSCRGTESHERAALLGEIDRLRHALASSREALELISAPPRSDGTWNRDREACRQIAAGALGWHEDVVAPLYKKARKAATKTGGA